MVSIGHVVSSYIKSKKKFCLGAHINIMKKNLLEARDDVKTTAGRLLKYNVLSS